MNDVFEFVCPHCKKTTRVRATLLGKKGKCPKCQQEIQISRQQSGEEEFLDMVMGNERQAAVSASTEAHLPPALPTQSSGSQGGAGLTRQDRKSMNQLVELHQETNELLGTIDRNIRQILILLVWVFLVPAWIGLFVFLYPRIIDWLT